jgi:hypothetical protein
MKISQVTTTNRFDTLLPAPYSNEEKSRNTFQGASKYEENEISLRPIAVIENPLIKKSLSSESGTIGTIVDIYV